MKRFFILFLVLSPVFLHAFDIVLLKYETGDWYNARDGVGNLIDEIKSRTLIDIGDELIELSLDDEELFEYSFLILNGHVPVKLSEDEKTALRSFILGGGFLFINDDYGIDESVRELISEVFPDYPFEELSFSSEIYHCFYDFDEGIPKIHEHDALPPEGWGLLVDGRVAIYYAYSSDIADGWDFPEVHGDSEEIREKAFQMGVNIVVYALTH